MKKFAFIVLIILINFAAIGQQKTIKFNSYGIEEGLSQSHVTNITIDDFGYVWVATQDGLNQFNGYQFNILNTQIFNHLF